MYLDQVVYKITDYLILGTSHQSKNDDVLVLYIDYSYKLGIVESSKTCNLMFDFNKQENLYKLVNHKFLMEIVLFLVKDKMLIKKDNNYYLTESALLRIL